METNELINEANVKRIEELELFIIEYAMCSEPELLPHERNDCGGCIYCELQEEDNANN
jgi:hypothetical protein